MEEKYIKQWKVTSTHKKIQLNCSVKSEQVSYWMATKQDVCDIHYTQVQHYSGTAENL
jgi:hypothetical protein